MLSLQTVGCLISIMKSLMKTAMLTTANNLVHFNCSPGQIVGVDNGEQASRERVIKLRKMMVHSKKSLQW